MPKLERCVVVETRRRFGPLCFYRQGGIGWFRLFGYGLHWKDTRLHRLIFSERNGKRRGLRVGPFLVKFLFPALVACFTITDPDQRAYCSAIESRSVGQCSFIADPALRRTCQARVSGDTSRCDNVNGAWEREKCRREARP